jgi:hypothetical protein
MKSSTTPTKGRVALLAATILVVVGLTPSSSWALPTTDINKVPSRWAPTRITSLMQNSATSWNVAYWFSWKMAWGGPASQNSNYWTTPSVQGTIEIGVKNSGMSECRSPATGLGRAGFPAGVDLAVDGSEDSDDAVVWISSLHQLRADQQANPPKEYSVWWQCTGSLVGDTFDAAGGAYLEAQLGAWHGFTCPCSTFARETLRYVPPESGFKLLPTTAASGQVQTTADAPWPDQWNFEEGDSSWTPLYAARYRMVGSSLLPGQGNAYEHLQPITGGLFVPPSVPVPHTYLTQAFKVRTWGTKGPFYLGSNTNYTYEGWFRCAQGSPAWSLKPGTNCRVTVYLRTVAHGWSDVAFTWDIPADGAWYFISADNWHAQTSDDDIVMWIDGHGYSLDIDAQWVSSGL